MYDKDLDDFLSNFQTVINYMNNKEYPEYYINKKGIIINAKNRTMRVMKPKVNNWGVLLYRNKRHRRK